MKRVLVAVALMAVSLTAVATDAEARRRGGSRTRTEVITTAPAIDPLTLMLLLGGGGAQSFGVANAGFGANPLALLLGAQSFGGQTTIIETERRGRRGGWRRGPGPRPVPSSR
jgi:hypothetical protein